MLSLNGLIGNHSVLQRGKYIKLSGTSIPGHRIRLVIASFRAIAESTLEGSFVFNLPPIQEGGPFDLQLDDLDSGKVKIFTDIYFGDVYLISGQSNMAMTLGDANDINCEYEDKLIRHFEVTKEAKLFPENPLSGTSWTIADSESLHGFSAVGFHFARKLRAHQPNVTIGLVNASYGGTNIESWISRDSLLGSSVTAEETQSYEEKIAGIIPTDTNEKQTREDVENKLLQELYSLPFANHGTESNWHKPYFDDRDWEELLLPDSWSMQGIKSFGTFWFRLKVDIPETWTGRELRLHLGAIDQQDISYWNGSEIGATGHELDISKWNHNREYAIAPKLVFTGENQIAVRATSIFPVCTFGGFIGPEEEMYICPADDPKDQILLATKWKLKAEHLVDIDIMAASRQLGDGEPHSFHTMFDNMIAPLEGGEFAAVLFYQGEANTLGNTENYKKLLTLLIADWRKFFNASALPFIIVQLPGFMPSRLYSPHSNWAKIRDSQLKAGMEISIPPVVSIDSGNANDLHPADKTNIGTRAAFTALALQGKTDIPLSGPVYKQIEKLDDNKLRLTFDTFGDRLVIREDTVNHMVIASDDRVFYKASSLDDGSDSIIIWSDEVKSPKLVCYAWSNNPEKANIFNSFGQPASPFRITIN